MSVVARALLAASAMIALAPAHVDERESAVPDVTGETARVGDRPDVLTLKTPGSPMLLVPAGSFVMGSTGDDIVAAIVDCQREPGGDRCDQSMFANEAPLHRVTLSAYWLDRTEVTVGEYARCAATGRCAALPFGEGSNRFDQSRLPASLVTWDEARTYCEYRGARLPTEAEFERAARGVIGRRYPWGDLYNAHAANHGRLAWQQTDASDGFAELAPVGSFPSGKTPDGFLDLAGNVSEWVSDRFAPVYDESDAVDPQGPPVSGSSPARVVRGGDYRSPAAWLRGATRSAEVPGARRPWIGFRCARSARSSG
ncbi:MAG TPA: SUMF1/EgtB/PvdO family nonheme iron enzyme [Polyangiaceae bacterium]|jgi:formylglycine-generating enzyme required for sulfatase activity|nr:SUMF1/EgtB/PvdO family nonheme iron enzyme [Polyangiaceae bacterium]